MNRVASRAFGVAAVMIGLALPGVTAAGNQQKEPSAASGWVKLPAAGETTTTAFVSVDNPTMYAIYLLSASADVAGKVEMRETAKDGTEKTTEEVTVPAYGAVQMEPKGLHLVLSDLKKPLKEGDTVLLSVTTEAGTKLDVAAPVKKE
jgi:copper(I)-binding protein